MSKKNKKMNRMVKEIRDMFLEQFEEQLNCMFPERPEVINKAAIENAKGARVDLLEDVSEVKLNEDGHHPVCNVTRHYGSGPNVLQHVLRNEDENCPPTVIILANRNMNPRHTPTFNPVLKHLMMVSDFGAIYREICDNWSSLLDLTGKMDCVLFIPNITVTRELALNQSILSFPNMVSLSSPKTVNVLIYATTKHPRVTKEQEDEPCNSAWESSATPELTKRLINSILESATRLNCPNLIIEPFDHPLLIRGWDFDQIMCLWTDALREYKNNGVIQDVHFVIDKA